MRSVPRLMFLCIPLTLAVGCGKDDTTGPQVNPNRAWLENVTVAPGNEVTMDLMIHNAEPIIFAQLPFKFSGTGCAVKSIEFAGPFATPLLSNPDEDSDPNRCNTWAAVGIQVPAGDHQFATITFTIDAQAPAEIVKVEDYSYIGSSSIDPRNNLYKHFPNFGTFSGKVLDVDFTDGKITVQPPPS